MDLKRRSYSIDVAGRPLTLELSRLAEQANASVLGRYGDTVVLVTATMSDKDKTSNYFPLLVDYEERFYAAGKIMGSRFVRREGRPSEDAVLSGRLIDRTIRPLFDQRMRREVQVVVTVLAYDETNDPDFLALVAASTALHISRIPWNGPVAGLQILKRPGEELRMNPTVKEKTDPFSFFAFISGAHNAINMIELEGMNAAEEDVVAGAVAAQREIDRIIAWQEEIAREHRIPKENVPLATPSEELRARAKTFLNTRLKPVLAIAEKPEREARMRALTQELAAHCKDAGVPEPELVFLEDLVGDEVDALVRKTLFETNRRPDGRGPDEVRDLHAETGLFKRTHGSALFIRGNTQALAITTLAPPGAEQLVETMEFSGKRRFLLHYNFPAYSVGEIGPFRGPGRREIGHGALASKALKHLIPPKETFPYTIRVVSEILSSNGSSSMATVCATSLSLMDAGVPLPAPVAGIAMGLMMDEAGKHTVILTDIQGPEDHYGDMDFKAAGTAEGVTAVQMDVKINGISPSLLRDVLAKAKTARLHILGVMTKTLAAPRPELSPFAPFILTLNIPPDKIGEVIGPGGKIINGIVERTGALSIDIEQTGAVFIAGSTKESAQAAYNEVESITRVYKVGDIVEGPVVKLLEFGAIVQFGPGRDGMIHVSEMKNGYVKAASDVVKIGDHVRAKIVRVEDGRIGLSLKQMGQQNGAQQ